MSTSLPTVDELKKLPIRAIVAYAARNARRIAQEFRGIIGDAILDEALELTESVGTADLICEIDASSVVSAAQRVVAAFAEAPESMKTAQKLLLLFSQVQAGMAAMDAILAAKQPSYAPRLMETIAANAQRGSQSILALDNQAANAAKEAARRDYDILLKEYGQHKEVILGEPVYCFGGKKGVRTLFESD
jgi:hypothetical protein